MRSGRGRGFFFGNLLLVIGVALLGGAVSAASSGGVAGARTVAATESIAPAALPPLVQSPAVTTPATPAATPPPATPEPETTPSTAATPAPATPTAAAEVSPPTPTQTPSPTPTPVATPEPTPTPSPTPEPTPAPRKPGATHISIPAVGIDTKIVEVGYDVVTIEGQQVIQWQVADYAAGHNDLSANPGEGGNVVISGHDDWRGEVFRTLEKVKVGDQIVLTTPEHDYHYAITEIYFRKEVGVPLEERLATGMFLAPTSDERVTLVTCWPYGIDDHRIIVVAKPVG